MKYILSLTLLLLIPLTVIADPISPEVLAEIEQSRVLLNDKRNTTLAFNMSFTETERAAFWPLYEQYRKAMSNVGSRRLDMIIDYANHYDDMTEDKAADLLRRAMVYEEQALRVKQLYMEKAGLSCRLPKWKPSVSWSMIDLSRPEASK